MKFIPIIFIAFLPTIVFADYLYTNNIIGACGDTYYYTAVLEPISYTCSSGQYLPAGAISCEVCPNTHTCNGGTFAFNTNQTQGLNDGDILVQNAISSCSPQFNQIFNAIFEPISYPCSSGYYLPADSENCEICPPGSYCVGGTYTFNEAETQGIEPCPSGTFSPGGTAYCYEHILHVGENMVYLKHTKLTTPSLNVGMDDGVFYANMTTIPTLMNRDSEHYLKIKYDNTIYYVCDDTMCGE